MHDRLGNYLDHRDSCCHQNFPSLAYVPKTLCMILFVSILVGSTINGYLHEKGKVLKNFPLEIRIILLWDIIILPLKLF